MLALQQTKILYIKTGDKRSSARYENVPKNLNFKQVMKEKEHNMEIMISDLSHHLNATRQCLSTAENESIDKERLLLKQIQELGYAITALQRTAHDASIDTQRQLKENGLVLDGHAAVLATRDLEIADLHLQLAQQHEDLVSYADALQDKNTQ